jgi:uncharacterized protein
MRSRHFIDCDAHEALPAVSDLAKYLKQPWADWVSHGWSGIYASPYAHPLTAPGYDNRGGATEYAIMREEYLDKHEVDRVILTGLFYPAVMRMQPQFATALAAAYNDWLIEEWLDKDRRLLGSIQIAPQEPEAAAREIDRSGTHPSMVQVMLPITDADYGQSRFDPIFAAAERNNLAIALHQSTATVSPVGAMNYYVAWKSALPLAFMAQVISLIFNGVFEKYPSLHAVMLEGGFTWLAPLMWRLDQHYRYLHVEVPWLRRPPSQVIRDHFRFATQPIEDVSASQLLTLFDWAGSDSLLVFSSDYPHWDSDEPLRALPPGLPQSVQDKIMRTNALDVYERRLTLSSAT